MHPLPRTLVDGKMQIPKFASAMGYKTTGQVNGLLNRQGRSKSENGVEDTFAADDVRVTRLNAIADLVYAPHILDMESVGGLRMSLRHAYTEDALLVIQKEIGWRLTKTNDKKESVLLCWCASTAGFKLMAFRRSPDLARYILSHANMVVNGLNDAPTKALFYEPSIFKSYGRFNQASAA